MGRHYRLLFILMLLGGTPLASCQRQEPSIAPTGSPPVISVPTAEVTVAATTTPTSPAATSTRFATLTRASSPRPSPTAEPSATVTPSLTTASAPQPSPTTQPLPAVTATTTSLPTATAAAPVIHSFELVGQEELNPGKRLTFAWSAEGATASLIAGTRQRFIPWWNVPVSGTLTIDLTNTLFHDPGVTLQVFGPEGSDGTADDSVSETITIPWACDHDYFFSPAPERCPRDALANPQAAQQSFEGGRMVWLAPENKILVFFDSVAPGFSELSLRVYDDTWTPADPESDPEIVPPEGRIQPVRGFGKLWRNSPDVREGLGWALAPETAFTATWQFEFNESIGTISYLRLNDGRIARITGYYTGYGSWSYLE